MANAVQAKEVELRKWKEESAPFLAAELAEIAQVQKEHEERGKQKTQINLNRGLSRQLNYEFSNWNDGSSGSNDFGGIFIADSSVLLLQTDSMFHSFDGAPGTTLAWENSAFKAMNDTLVFP